jgi:uncharacterized protein YndB with AHSA1/START domain
MQSLSLQRRYEFAPSIVWDALVDPDLVGGWLGDAVIEPDIGGTYSVRGIAPGPAISVEGRIVDFDRLAHLGVENNSGQILDLTLDEVSGGNRGSSTRLTVRVTASVEAAFTARMRADWLISLDQLGDLLHGHPVEWQLWDRDYGGAWTGYLEQAGAAADGPGSLRHPHG